MPVQEMVKTVAHYTATLSEGIAVILIISGIVSALLVYLKKTLLVKTDYRAAAESRNHLGHSLSFGLEFLIAADILKTAISPTWQDIGQLAAIVGIRTVLNFFLTRELKQMEGKK
ncbi:MAG: DUF1622 domain-containing protein [Thermodesulfovibrionales bacterium]|jgi:uncharacterized membrane protein